MQRWGGLKSSTDPEGIAPLWEDSGEDVEADALLSNVHEMVPAPSTTCWGGSCAVMLSLTAGG